MLLQQSVDSGLERRGRGATFLKTLQHFYGPKQSCSSQSWSRSKGCLLTLSGMDIGGLNI